MTHYSTTAREAKGDMSAAVSHLIATIQAANGDLGKTTVVDLSKHEPDHIYGIQHPDGTMHLRSANLNPLRLIASSLGGFIAACRYLAERDDVVALDVFVTASLMEAYPDYEAVEQAVGRDRVSFAPTPTHAYACLSASTPSGPKWSQKELVTHLRTTFKGMVDDGFRKEVANLKWVQSDEERGKVEHGAESMGRDIVSNVTGADKIRETVELEVPFADELDRKVPWKAEVLIDVSGRTFELRPHAGMRAGAEHDVEVWAATDVRDGLKGLTKVHIVEGARAHRM